MTGKMTAPDQITNRRNHGQVTVEEGKNILEAALRDQRICPYGCRSGVWGACKYTLWEGWVEYGDYEQADLKDA